jgi:transcriptional regulator with XRE-family HTH domain
LGAAAVEDGNFARNLELLCSYYSSVSEVCRRLGINRQQFNKYLAGRAMPSRHNLRRICDFFGVEEAEILLPSRRFADIIELRPQRRRTTADHATHIDHLEALRQIGGNRLDAYLGYYYRYFYSYGFPGMIVKSLFGLFHKGDIYYSKNLGILSEKPTERRHAVRFKYLGLPLLVNDRIFLLEYESVLRDIVSETILYPAYRRIDLLLGVQCTLAGRRSREPAAGKVVFEFLGRDIQIRRALRSCGLFRHDGDEVAPAIKARLDNHIADDAFVLLVSES